MNERVKRYIDGWRELYAKYLIIISIAVSSFYEKVKRYIDGWRIWLWAVHKARTKKHGAGKQRWSHAFKSAACCRHIVDGQWCNPPRFPRYLK